MAVTSEYREPGQPRPAGGLPLTLASDGDRDGAAALLDDAFAQGRLTADEHGERVRAAYVARTWPQLATLTADLPEPADGIVRAAEAPALMRAGPDPCLLCALLIVCPPAGIAWLLVSRHHARAGGSR